GAAVISTPYLYARDLLADERGLLFDFCDANALSKILNNLLENPILLDKYRGNARSHGETMQWPNVGRNYAALLHSVRNGNVKLYIAPGRLSDLIVDLSHIQRLTNSVGIAQHAKYATPDYHHGYCLDDNCRALMLAGLANLVQPGSCDKLIDTYLAFVHYVQR